MDRCRNCRKEFENEDGMEGKEVPKNGVISMGYGSRHDLNKYKFTLIAGWYCWECLDKEVDQGLVQPLIVHYLDKSGAMDSVKTKKYKVRGLENEI